MTVSFMGNLKVVHLNTYKHGGAGVAAGRLVNALSLFPKEIDAQLLDASFPFKKTVLGREVQTKIKFASDIAYFSLKEAHKKYRFAFSTAYFGSDISKSQQILNADIIHIHWINQGFLSIKNLKQLFALKKPIVWTLHDMWAFTGGCHYTGECNNFKQECGNCFYLKNPQSLDISHKGWLRKVNLFKTTQKINFIACSNWMMQKAQESTLLKDFSIQTIPNPIDTHIFCEIAKADLRKKFNIDKNKKVILFGAAKIVDERKGITYLLKALHLLKANTVNDDIEIVIFGKNNSFDISVFPYKVHSFPTIFIEQELVELYNLADAFILPSLEDNLPNMAMEALSCGLPVVAFNNGGAPDLVQHFQNGYLANYLSAEDLAKGILWVLHHPNPALLKEKCRRKVIDNFSMDIVAEKYLSVYQQLTGGQT